ncbi:aromatic acid exporter family protein [Bacillus tianshenii]|nr:aromatic acid exporter family protein [Bacillus tianshenii]
MKEVKRFKIAGGRIVKTAISVFITAIICHQLNLPAIFAVITAIVTTEPTASDSVRKGIIRLPASAIGAAISMFFSWVFGETAHTYALAAVLTIWTCNRLKLDEGTLVATLTAVAMIPDVHDHFLLAFVSRLGTTAIGLTVSTVVNFMIMPPKYSPMILNQIDEICNSIGTTLKLLSREMIEGKGSHLQTKRAYRRITKQLERTMQLSDYQHEEFRYHKHSTSEVRIFHYATKQVNLLQQFVFHLGNLQYAQLNKEEFCEEEKDLLKRAIDSIILVLKDPNHHVPEEHFAIIKELDHYFWHWKRELAHQPTNKYHHHFASHTIILYEILSMHDALEELEHLVNKAKGAREA